MDEAAEVRRSSSATPSVSVVICAHAAERWDDLLRAIRSVGHQTYPALETIVVVDGNPRLLTRLQAERLPARIVENSGPPGLSRARGEGIATSSGDIIAFLDDDAAAAPEWLERLIQSYDADRVLGVGGAIDADWVGGRPRWFPPELDWVVGCSYRGLPTRTAPVRNMIGANMSFRRSVLERVGGFSAEFGRSGLVISGGRTAEETEFCIRAANAIPDGIFVYEPGARVLHRVPSERASAAYLLRRCFAEGRAKARVTRIAGARDGLSAETAYVLQILPGGILGGLREGFGGDVSGFRRAGAIAGGLITTVAGFVVASLASLMRTPTSDTDST